MHHQFSFHLRFRASIKKCNPFDIYSLISNVLILINIIIVVYLSAACCVTVHMHRLLWSHLTTALQYCWEICEVLRRLLCGHICTGYWRSTQWQHHDHKPRYAPHVFVTSCRLLMVLNPVSLSACVQIIGIHLWVSYCATWAMMWMTER